MSPGSANAGNPGLGGDNLDGAGREDDGPSEPRPGNPPPEPLLPDEDPSPSVVDVADAGASAAPPPSDGGVDGG